MKIAFLHQNLFGIGGTVRTVLNLAEALSGEHDIELVSVFRRTERALLQFPMAASVRWLVDMRTNVRPNDRGDPRHRESSTLVPNSEEYFGQYSHLTDERLVDYLSASDADVIIGTRPGLNLLVAQFAPDRSLRIAQEHMSHLAIPEGTRRMMAETYGRLDASVTVTAADARTFAETTPVPDLLLETIPNSVPGTSISPSTLQNHLVIAAGRLDQVKRYDLLVHAFAAVVDRFPDWKLRIYGSGPEAPALRRLILELELHNSVQLMGSAKHLESEWVKGSIAVSSSDRESFGMTLIEAMRAGLPLISTDCPDGPREIITHGIDGLLTPIGDSDALADAMCQLIAHPEMRNTLGEAARLRAHQYESAVIAEQYVRLFDTLADRRTQHANTTPLPETVEVVGASAGRPRLVERLLGRGARLAEATKSVALGRSPGKPIEDVSSGMFTECQVLASDRWRLTMSSRQRITDIEFVARRGETHTYHLPRNARVGTSTTAEISLTTMMTQEGRWDVFAVMEKGQRVRLRPRVFETRALYGEPVRRGLFYHAVPYETNDSYLAAKVWLRPWWAELDHIDLLGDELSMRGVTNLPVGPGAHLSLRRRHDDALATFPANIHSDRSFSATVALPEVALASRHRHEDWDVFLRTPGNEARLSRIWGDVVDRKPIDHYPTIKLHTEEDRVTGLAWDSPETRQDLRPFLTVDNEVTISSVRR